LSYAFHKSDPWHGMGIASYSLVVLLASYYVVSQLMHFEEVKDPLFIGILLAAALITIRFGLVIRREISKIDAEIKQKSDLNLLFPNIEHSTFNNRGCFLTGILFVGLFSVSAFFMQPWPENSQLKLALISFIGAVNFITGMAVYSILVHIFNSMKIGKSIEIMLWDRTCPLLLALINTNNLLVKAVSLIASLSVISLIFSVFKVDGFIYGFTIYVGISLVSVFVLPMMPITNKIRDLKLNHMSQISSKLQKEYDYILNSSPENKKINSANFESLLSTYKSIKSVKAFPPVAEKSFNTAVYATLLTMLPSTIDLIYKSIH
jgi:hypothetical protein